MFGVPSPTVAGSKNDITLTARDAFGNVADGFTGGVTFTTTDPQSTAANGGLPTGFAFATGDYGTKTIAQQVSLKTVGVQSITATDVLTSAVTGTQAGIVVVPAAPSRFTLTGHASPVVAGSMNDFTVTAFDPYGNLATSYTGTVRFTSSDPQAGEPVNYTFTSGVGAGFDNGVHTFVAGSQLKTAGTQSLTVTDTVTATITGTQSGIVVTPAPAASFNVSGITTPLVAGAPSDVSLVARDPYNNIDTNYAGTVTFTSSDPQVSAGVGLPANFTFTAGTGKATLTQLLSLRTVGTQSVTVTDVSKASVTGTQTGIVVTPGAAKSFTVYGITNPFEAGKLSNVQLTARDAFGNVDTNFMGDVSFFSSDPLVSIGDGLPVNLTFFAADKGQSGVTDQVSLRTAGLQSVSAKDTKTGLVVGTQSNILVTPTTASSLKLGGHRSPVVAGTFSDFTATAFDRFGNVATGYKGTLRVTSSDAQASEPADYAFTAADAGAHTFLLGSQLKTAGKQSVTATDTVTKTISATQSNITVVAAPASQFAVTGHPSPVVAGSKNGFTVLATDAFGNRATTYTGSVGFTSTDLQVVPGNGLPNIYTFTPADAGTHLFVAGAQLKTAGFQAIGVTDLANGFAGAQSNILVTSAPATTLNLTGFPIADHGRGGGHLRPRGPRPLRQPGDDVQGHRALHHVRPPGRGG